MSTAAEIARLTDARNTIRDKLIELGLATSTAKLDALATAIDAIVNRGAVSATVQEGEKPVENPDDLLKEPQRVLLGAG